MIKCGYYGPEATGSAICIVNKTSMEFGATLSKKLLK